VVCHRGSGGLLQCLVGEQPARRLGDLAGGTPAQQCGLDQGGGALTEACAYRVDVTDPGPVVEGEPVDLGQCGRTRITGEVGDVGQGEIQDGLTPVIITL